jgi:hypothetical protein
MDKQNIVVTYNASPEQKALLLEVLGSLATLTFLNEIQSAQREQTLERADVLLSWNFPREILSHEYPSLQHVKFIQLIDAWWTEPFLHGTFRMDYPFLELPNVLGSPHNSAVVSNIILEAARQAAENVKHFLEGEKVIGIVRREDYLW